MRRLLIIALLFPTFSYAVGQEECWYEGKVGKRKIILTYQDITSGRAGWRNSKYRSYNYCEESESPNEILSTDSSYNGDFFFVCYEKYTPKTKPTIAYKSVEQNYVCISGCNSGAARKLTMKCETGC